MREQPVFCALFVAMAVATVVGHWRVPFGPGQDYHYHLMVAAMNARSASDPVAALYHPVSWFDANTLIYRVAWPFEKLFDPSRAFSLALMVELYVGFPLAVAYALKRTGRAPWGALFAFVAVYCKSWSINGYVPFLTGSTWMVLSLAEWSVLFDRPDEAPRTNIVRGALFTSAMFLAHGHVYAWTTALLALFTLIAIGAALSKIPRDGARAALRRAWQIAWRSLVTIGPSLLLFGLWYLRTHSGAAAARSNQVLVPYSPTIEAKSMGLIGYFIHTRGEHEFHFFAAMVIVALAALLFGRRSTGRGPWFELFAVLSLWSYFLLPESVTGQSISPRHIDIAFWAVPLVLWPTDESTIGRTADAPALAPWKRPALDYLLAALLFAFSVGRVRNLTSVLETAARLETGPILQLVEPCRRARRAPFSVLGHAPMTRESAVLHSPTMHQVHESLAALCGVETPVYDTSVFPHNLLPLRYRTAMPAPPIVFERDPAWYANPTVWEKFDLMLTSNWTPSSYDEQQLSTRAELVATSGVFRLYRRR